MRFGKEPVYVKACAIRTQYDVETLCHYEMAHYRTHSFTATQIDGLKQHLRQADPGHDLKVNIHARQQQLTFPFAKK